MLGTKLSRIFWAGWSVFLLVAPASGQWSQKIEEPCRWQVSVLSGFLTGGSVYYGKADVEIAPGLVVDRPYKVKAPSSWLTGVRIGSEKEYIGWEVSVAGSFADLDIKRGVGMDLPSGRDLTMLLGGVNALFFPGGDSWSEGRLRPFITAGLGAGYFDSNFKPIGRETKLDINVGGGIKMMLGETGKHFLRLDWRWHQFTAGGSGLKSDLYRQELTLGLGVPF